MRRCRTRLRAERAFGLEAGQAAGRVEHRAQLVAFGQFAIFGGDAPGDLFKLFAAGKIMLDDDEELLQLYGHLDYRRQDDHERAVLLADCDLLGQGLDDFRAGAGSGGSWSGPTMAELSAQARALIERMAASGSLPPASADWPLVWPGICRPCSMSHVASRQFCSRQSWAISRRASSCSWLSIQRPVKQAEIYSARRCASCMENTSW